MKRYLDVDLISLILLVTGLGFFLLACRTSVPHILSQICRYNQTLLKVGLAAIVLLASCGIVYATRIPKGIAAPHHYQNDAIAMSDCGTRLFLNGHNPYTDFYLVDCLSQHELRGDAATALQAGAFAHYRSYPPGSEQLRVFEQDRLHHIHWPAEFEGRFSYPAGTFLFAMPVMALGWRELSVFNLLWLVLSYVMLILLAPHPLRFWILIFAFANIDMWVTAVGIAADSLDVFLVLTSWAAWRRSWLSAFLFGVAIATRQNAWFFIPFYSILIGRTYGARALIQRLTVMAFVFFLINGPFLLKSPAAWIHGVLAPMQDLMFPFGYGLITLAKHGWLPLWPHSIYTILQLAAMGICAAVYARTCRRHPGTGLVLALVPVLLAWRSSPSYFAPLPIFCLWPLVDTLRHKMIVRNVSRAQAKVHIADAGKRRIA